MMLGCCKRWHNRWYNDGDRPCMSAQRFCEPRVAITMEKRVTTSPHGICSRKMAFVAIWYLLRKSIRLKPRQNLHL